MENRKRARRIAVISGKGGVGKSVITANVAAALALSGRKILVIDADLGLANLDIMLGIEPKFTIFDILHNGMAVDEVLCPTMKGFDLIPAGSSIPEGAVFSERMARNMERVLAEIENRYDAIIFDVGAGIGDVVMFFAGIADELLVVATPEPTSVMDAYATIKVLNQLHDKSEFLLVVNQANPRRVEEIGESIAEHLSNVASKYLESGNPVRIELVGCIPEDPMVPRTIRDRRLLIESHPEAPSAHHLNHLASYIDMRLST